MLNKEQSSEVKKKSKRAPHIAVTAVSIILLCIAAVLFILYALSAGFRESVNNRIIGWRQGNAAIDAGINIDINTDMDTYTDIDTVMDDSPIVIPAHAVVYTDEQEMELFLDEMQWNMPDLLQQEVYLAGDEINIDFWFSEAAGFNQIDGARSFAITAFVIKHAYPLGLSPYDWLLIDSDVMWKTVSCKVYQGPDLLYHDCYDEHGLLIR